MFNLLLTYRYAILIPLAIVEGPIVTVVGGFLATMGYLNPLLVYLIGVMGDLIGDSIAYSVGRFGSHKFIEKHGPKFGLKPQKLEETREYFRKYHRKAILLSKVVHGLGVVGLVGAGTLKIPYARFISTCVLISFVQSAVLMMLGMVFGSAYLQIGKYLDYFAATISILALIVVLVAVFYYRKNKKNKAHNDSNQKN